MKLKTIQINIWSLPEGTPVDQPLYLAGNFNEWNPCDEQAIFTRKDNGYYSLTIPSEKEYIECKVTRGHWDRSEGDANNQPGKNRLLISKKDIQQFWLSIDSWTDLITAYPKQPIRAMVIHQAMPIPGLNRTRKVWAHLPFDYWTSEKKYPVIYMMDGQNLFSNEYKASWNVDRALHQILNKSIVEHQSIQDYIIIGVEHGEEYRIDEYSAWKNEEFGGGDAPVFLDFICNQVKKFVDQNFRTRSERKDTILIGSSMGGLFVLYASLERQDVFGHAGIFSPSLWFSKDILSYVTTKSIEYPVRFLLMAGQKESQTMTSDLLELYDTLLEAGHADQDIHYDLHKDGSHHENYWAKEFEFALDWLSGGMTWKDAGVISNNHFRFDIDPSQYELKVFIHETIEAPSLRIFDYCHHRSFYYNLYHGVNRIPYEYWKDCLCSLRLNSGDDLIYSRRALLSQLRVIKETPTFEMDLI